jgi:hypothetical protein
MSNREPKTRYGFPELIDPFTPFPAEPPWDEPIYKLSGWWLEVRCGTHGMTGLPLRLLAATQGWNRTLREIVPLLSCSQCKAAPMSVDFVSDIGGEIGRYGHKVACHHLLEVR